MEQDEISQNDVIEMARQAGFEEISKHEWAGYTNSLEAFAKLVAAKERELCITDIQWHIPRSGRNDPEYLRAKSMIERIRARGSNK